MKVKSYTIKSYYEKYEGNDFSIPRFQRSAASWKNDKRRKLVESILEKYPIGLITTTKTKNKKISILDGLQRTTSLIQIYNTPWSFMPEYSYEEIQKLPSTEGLKIKKLITEIKKFNENSKNSEAISTKVFWEKLQKIKTLNKLLTNLGRTFENDFKKWAKKVEKNIREDKEEYIHVLTMDRKHDINSMIEAFKRINSEGKALSRFELLSGRWAHYKIKGLSEEFINRYKTKKLESIWSIEVYETPDQTLMPHEYIKGLLKDISEKLPTASPTLEKLIMPKSKNKEQNIIEIIKAYLKFHNGIPKIIEDEEIGSKLSNINNIQTWTETFVECIIEVLKEVDRLLWMFRLKTTNKKITPTNSGVLLATLYLIEAKNSTNDIKTLKRNLAKNILWHKIEKTFGSGSTQNVWNFVLDGHIYNNDWKNKISTKIENNFYDMNDKRDFDNIIKMLSTLIYLKNNDNILNDQHHYDHLIPFAKLNDWGVKNSSTYANISLIPDNDNLGKKHKFKIEYLEKDLNLLSIKKDRKESKTLINIYNNLIKYSENEDLDSKMKCKLWVEEFFLTRNILMKEKIDELFE